MRFIVLLFSLFLVSCATPKTAPQSFYNNVYVPGKVEIGSAGKFESSASVISGDDLSIAQKAAYARFMISAKSKGYRYFKITDEKTTSGLGKTFRLTGHAYKQANTGKGVYEIDAIRRLLEGLPLEAPRPVVKPKPKVVKKSSKNPVTSNPVAPVSAEPVASEDPTVIMAPEDITGSISKDGVSGETTSSITSAPSSKLIIDTPKALNGVPAGVVVRAN